MLKLKPYHEYKNSGLSLLGKIPAHWNERRAKYFFREVDERSSTGQEELLSVSHMTGVSPRSEKNVTMFMAESYVGHKLCQAGDLVINTMWAWMAALGVARQTGIVSPSYAVYRPIRSNLLLHDFVDHLLRTKPYASEYVCRSTGIRSSRLRLYPEKFLDIPIICPPYEEQEQILAFLQVKDQAIRRFIRAKRRLIELLNEQKQAIISRAMSRGLDPSVRLKPSSIDWLGDVPGHWEVLPIKRVLARLIDTEHKTAPAVDGGRYMVVRTLVD
jgi:type I restriction enzyme S subunit